MPTYEYRREDGTTFEIEQRITEAPLETCPETGQKVSRLISRGAGLVFKGSGFYLTDYARPNAKDRGKDTGAKDTEGSGKEKSSDKGSDKGAAEASESKEPKKAAKESTGGKAE